MNNNELHPQFYILHPIKDPNTEYCAWYDNVFSDEEITTILNLDEWSKQKSATVGAGYGKVDPGFRESYVSWLNPSNSSKFIFDRMANIVSQINTQFFKFNLTGFYEGIQLTTYDGSADTPHHFNWHVDDSKHNFLTGVYAQRKLSVVLQLNDPSEFEGGSLRLLDAYCDKGTPRDVELQKSRAWFFPSWVLHQVTPVTKGVRKTLVLWVHGPQFK